MSTISKPHTFAPNTTISSSQVNSNFDTLYNDYNGNINASNLATDAVSTAKIADNAVTTAKIADSNVTSAKINFGGAGAGIWWQEIGRTTLSVAGDTISVASLPARRHLRIFVTALNTGGTIGLQMRFNNDSTSGVYARRESSNGAADTTGSGTVITNVSAAAYPIRLTGEILNLTSSEKVIDYTTISFNTAGGSNVPGRLIGVGKWANTTDQITRIDALNTGTGDYAIGSEMVVLGHD